MVPVHKVAQSADDFDYDAEMKSVLQIMHKTGPSAE